MGAGMKVGAINSCNTNYLKQNNSVRQYAEFSLKTQKPTFCGIADSFEKNQSKRSPEQEASDIIQSYVKKEAIKDYKILKQNRFSLYFNLLALLKIGKSNKYQNYIPNIGLENQESISFGEIDEKTKLPKNINFWRNGNLKAVYEIYDKEPKLSYSYTKYDGDVKKQYTMCGLDVVSFFATDDSGEIVFLYPQDNGFIRQELARTENNEAMILSELYYDCKNSKHSYYRENSKEGVVEYKFDKKQNMWIEQGILSKEELDN